MMQVSKAIIPVAGFGTRFLPVAKSIPKEMLPILDKPIVQFVVEELVEAGIKDIIFVTSGYKKAIEDYFNPHFELEYLLGVKGKTDELKQIKRLSNLANLVFIRQKEIAGNGDAILTAQPAVGDEPFLAFWGDDLVVAKPSRTQQLIKAFERYNATILGCFRTENPEDGGKCGFVTGTQIAKRVMKVKDLVEKPGIGKAPSSWVAKSGNLFTPEIFISLREAQKKIRGQRELTYIDGLNELKKKQSVYALELEAQYYDTGDKLEYLKTVVEFGIKNKEFGEEFGKYIKKLQD